MRHTYARLRNSLYFKKTTQSVYIAQYILKPKTLYSFCIYLGQFCRENLKIRKSKKKSKVCFQMLGTFLKYFYSKFWSFIPISGILLHFLEFLSIFWNFFPFFGISFQFLEFLSNFWNFKPIFEIICQLYVCLRTTYVLDFCWKMLQCPLKTQVRRRIFHLKNVTNISKHTVKKGKRKCKKTLVLSEMVILLVLGD